MTFLFPPLFYNKMPLEAAELGIYYAPLLSCLASLSFFLLYFVFFTWICRYLSPFCRLQRSETCEQGIKTCKFIFIQADILIRQ